MRIKRAVFYDALRIFIRRCDFYGITVRLFMNECKSSPKRKCNDPVYSLI